MNEDHQRNWLVIVLVVAVLICAIAVYINQGQLPAYIDAPSETSSPSAEVSLPEFETYTFDQLEISFQKPALWQQIIMNGNVAFIDTDGTYLMLQLREYQPEINIATEDSIANELAASGKQLLYFKQLSTSAFAFSYQSESVMTYEYVTWDLKNECRVIISTETENAESMLPLVNYVYDSFKWNKDSPIPDTIRLAYNNLGAFEFAYPASWEYGTSSEAFSARNPDSNSVFCVTVSQSNKESLAGITELQYAQGTSQSRPNLFMKRYAASDRQITAESVYSSTQGEQVLFYHVIILENGFQYEFLLDTPVATGETDYNAIQECLKYFRTF